MRQRRQSPTLIFVLGLVVGLAGCAHAPSGQSLTIEVGERLPPITDATIEAQLRRYQRLPFDALGRSPMRAALTQYYAGSTPGILDDGDYETVIDHFRRMTDLLTPDDFDEGSLPEQLGSIARFIDDEGSPPGDEARVMSALLVLAALEPSEGEHRRRYEELTRWSREARTTYGNPLRGADELIEVWQEHAMLTPARAVLETLATLHLDRRDLILQHLSSQGFDLGMARRMHASSPLRLRWAPLEIAAIFLAHGDVTGALHHVEPIASAGETERQVVRTLQTARAPTDAADEALLDLAQIFTEARPEVASGICQYGIQQRPENGLFARCLARVAAAAERYEAATGWYAEAITAQPEERTFYDEALEQLNRFIEQGLFDTDVDRARNTARHAEEILERRLQRWPNSAPPIEPDQLQYLMGILEMRAGNPDGARRHLLASIELEPSVRALSQLGSIDYRTGRAESAVQLLWRALDILASTNIAEETRRCGLLSHLAGALAETTNQSQSERIHQQAITCWSELMPRLEGPAEALALVRRGILLDRLGNGGDAVIDFRSALSRSPNFRGPYAAILSHLVSGTPRADLAHAVFRRAMRELSLEPEWKVYFALWVQIIAGRAGAEVGEDVQARLTELASSTVWWGRLASFGAGEIEAADLLESAGSLAEETEALFYSGARALVRGDRGGAQALFEQVSQTQMVSFYEFLMARDLLRMSAEDTPAP